MGGTLRPARSALGDYVRAIANSYSEILFLNGPVAGAVVLAATFLNPNAGACGLMAVVAAYAFARLIAMDRSFLGSGFFTYNPLLVGLSIGYLYKITALTLAYAAGAGMMAFMLTLAMNHALQLHFRLPILSLPFALVSSLVYLAAGRSANLLVTAGYSHPPLPHDGALPLWAAGFFKALGAITFLPHVAAGMVFALLLLALSRILLLLAVAGYAWGTTVVAMLAGSFEQAYANVNAFNFILIAMAVGGVFLIPSPQSYAVALVAVAGAAILLQAVEAFWSLFGIPAFTIPFNLTTLVFLYSLGLVAFPRMARLVLATPEDSLDHALSAERRHCGEAAAALMLPFAGRWTVWQGFDGNWTHKGAGRHALDFVLSDGDGRTYNGDGSRPEDYFAFRKPVLAPVRGRVVKVVAHLPDNPIGHVDQAHPWGNVVVLRDEFGSCICLAHFARDSLRVAEGDWVERGTVLGLCGNSGYSPQPHIHLQVQVSEAIGAPSLPFSIMSWAGNGRFHANGVPAAGMVVEACLADREMERRFTFLMDERLSYDLFEDGRPAGRLELVVRSAADGSLYLESGRGRLYFGHRYGTFHAYSTDGRDIWLRAWLLALPRLPLAGRHDLSWTDHLPLGTMVRGPRRALLLLLTSFAPNLAGIRVDLTSTRDGVRGTARCPLLGVEQAVEARFDDMTGPAWLRAGRLELRRADAAQRGALMAAP